MKHPALTFSRSGRLTPVAAALMTTFLSPTIFAVEPIDSVEGTNALQTSHPQSAEFDSIFLNTEHGGSGIDLSRFSKGGVCCPAPIALIFI